MKNERVVELVKVRMHHTRAQQWVDANRIAVMPGDVVIVKSHRVTRMASAIGHRTRQIVKSEVENITRLATQTDLDRVANFAQTEATAMTLTKHFAAEHGLEMKPLYAECSFDDKYIIVHFSAEKRIDFRKLVQHLASRLHLRVEMRQTGIRPGAGKLCGTGICGHELCCSRFLSHFDPVATKLIKAQGLTHNPARNAGICGRLLCCLTFEYPHYVKKRTKLPRKGTKIWTQWGLGTICSVDIISSVITVQIDGMEPQRITRKDYLKLNECSLNSADNFIPEKIEFIANTGAVAVPIVENALRQSTTSLTAIKSVDVQKADPGSNVATSAKTKRDQEKRNAKRRKKNEDSPTEENKKHAKTTTTKTTVKKKHKITALSSGKTQKTKNETPANHASQNKPDTQKPKRRRRKRRKPAADKILPEKKDQTVNPIREE